MTKKALRQTLLWTLAFVPSGLAFVPSGLVFVSSPYPLTPTSTRPSILSSVPPDDDAHTVDDLWSTAGADAAKFLPLSPSPSLSAEEVLVAVFRGLQFVDVPDLSAGLVRCYAFMDLACKKLVTGHGNVPEERTLAKFVGHAAHSAKILPFLGADRLAFGETSRIPGTPTRGEIVTMPLRVTPKGKAEEQVFMVRLQKQRRPPLAGAYMVTDLIDVETVWSVSRPLN